MANATLQEIVNYLEVSERLGCAGQPTEDQLAAVQAAGDELVVNLALPDSPDALPDEAGTVRALGMEYVSIPVVWEKPTLDDLRRFFHVMEKAGERKVFVHCVLNMRVTAFLNVYLALRKGVERAEARRWMEQIWMPNPIWEKFLEKAFKELN